MSQKQINKNLDKIFDAPKYEQNNDIALPKGADESKIKQGIINKSSINKLHLIKIADNFPANEVDIPQNKDKFKVVSFSDLCKIDSRAIQYDIDDFLYCKNLGFPINRMITLRRFPYPCTDNIWDKETQGEPDIARMITYYSQNVNKLEDLLGFSYRMKWKELTSEFEQASMQGDQTGLSGFMKKAMQVFDPNLYNNRLRGENANMLDPKFDQNKTYGPVDSVTNTHIREVGLEFDKEFELTFDYELRSENGRTPEYAMKDLLANVLATTYNNGKFWPGARYWVGDRPSQYYQRFQYMNTGDMDTVLNQGYSDLKSTFNSFGSKGSAVDTLKAAMKGGMAMALGKILDKVGRPGILTMNSLLSAEPTGFWHVTIGNPLNPTLCLGNLIITDTEITFPTDSLSYGEFPTLMQIKVKLKPAQSKDRAGIEMMFNMGKHRLYFAPKKVTVETDQNNIVSTSRKFFGYEKKEIDNTLSQAYDFIAKDVESVSKVVVNETPVVDKTTTNTETNTTNYDKLDANSIKIP